MFAVPRSALAIAATAAVVLMLGNTVLTVLHQRRSAQDASEVAHTGRVLQSLADALSSLKDAETGVRGFVLSGDERYLEPWRTARPAIDDELGLLQRWLDENPAERASSRTLDEQARSLLRSFEQIIAERRLRSPSATVELPALAQAKTRMDALRALVADIGQRERARLAARKAERDGSRRAMAISDTLSDVAGLASLGALLLLFRRYRQRREADAAERIVALEDARESRSRLESILDAGEIGTWEYDIETGLIDGDTNLARIFGLSAQEARHAPVERYVAKLHPQDRERVSLEIEHALRDGDSYDVRFRLAQPDRSVRWIDARGRIRRDADGRARRMPGVVIDVTGRRLAEDARDAARKDGERMRRLYETVLSNTDVLHYVLDRQRRFVYVNPAVEAVLGRAAGDIVGKDAAALGYPPAVIEVQNAGIDDVVRTGEAACGEVAFPTPNGTRRFRFRFVPLFRGDGTVDAIAGSTQDITEQDAHARERERLVASLAEADRRKDEFIATLAHELRNPLAPIRNGIRLLHTEGRNRKAIQATTGMLERQVAQMVRLVEDLLDVGRISQGLITLRRDVRDLRSIVLEAVDVARPAFDEREQTLRVELPETPLIAYYDRVRLAQVLDNLLNNARKFTPPGGHVAIEAAREGDVAVLQVVDDGVGIAPEHLGRLFTMFGQITPSGGLKAGLGIGLALSRTLAELHGGTLEADSAGPGQGSRFMLRLPLHVQTPVSEAPDAIVPPARVEAPRDQDAAAPSVLVVDDNEDAAVSLAMLLEMSGHRVQTAFDGESAIGAVASMTPDVVVLDIGMPGIDGYETARRLRALPAIGESLRLIALTGWGQQEARDRSRAAGFDAHLVKPVAFDELTAVIDRR